MPRRSWSRRPDHRILPRALALAVLATVVTALPTAASAPAPGPRTDRQEETGRVGFISAPPGRPIDVGLPDGAPPSAVARGFLLQNAASLGLTARSALRVLEEHQSASGGRTVRLAQVHDGVPVLGGEFTVNLDEHGDVLSVLGEASPVGNGRTRPTVGARAAVRAAVAKVARAEAVRRGRLTAEPPELVLYDPRLLGATGPFQTARLSWVTEVRSDAPALAHTVVVDATHGAVSLDFSTIAHARSRTVCDANNTSSHYPCTSPVWTEGSQPAGVDADVSAAFDYAGDTYDFFAARFGRDSLDDAGMTLVSTVDYCDPGSACPYQNAFWDGSQMVYGDGFAAADDVVGHELAHGVTDHSSSLFYYMQSGAINESMSDIFGEFVDLTNSSGNDAAAVRWLVGEDVPVLGAIRDMEDPAQFGQPDRMGSPSYYGGLEDNGGVHVNSGVSNKAASLLTDGGTFNGRTIGALGLDKTALLFYAVNNDLLVSGSDFADLANAMRRACTDLAASGVGGFVPADCVKVEQAVLATEMDSNPAAAPTKVVPPCPTGSPTYVVRDDIESPSPAFATTTLAGSNAWFLEAAYASSGEQHLYGAAPGSLNDSAVRMASPVTIPAGAFLHFNHAYGFEGPNYDGGVVEYSTTGANGPWVDAGPLFSAGQGAGGYDGTIAASFGNPLAGRPAFIGVSHGYGSSRADLAALAGQSVMFRWRIGTDDVVQDLGWLVDDVSILTCGADTTPPDTTIVSGPAVGSTVTTSEVVLGFTATETGSTFECKLDGAAFSACTSPATWSGLTGGSHTFQVRAVDGAGNTDPTPASRTFTVALPDDVAPDTTLTKNPPATSRKRTAVFAFTSSEPGSTFECKLDGKQWATCSSPHSVVVAWGRHTMRVRATDAAGNTDATPATWQWRAKRRR